MREAPPKTKTQERIEIFLGFFLFFAVTGGGVYTMDQIALDLEANEMRDGVETLVKNLREWKGSPDGDVKAAAVRFGLVPPILAAMAAETTRHPSQLDIRINRGTMPPLIEITLKGLSGEKCRIYLPRITRGISNRRDLYAIWLGSAGISITNFPLVTGFKGCSGEKNVARLQYRLIYDRY